MQRHCWKVKSCHSVCKALQSKTHMSVLIETTLGDLVFDLYTEERPRSCLNFLKLCKIKYYNYCLFHSIRRNFIAQSGDPTGTGRGGVSVYSYTYGDQAKYFELELKPRIKHRTKGTISFVNNGNDMHGSQFFITLGDGLDFLDGKHTVFGQLAEGFDVLESLNETICDDNHKPYQDVRITHTIILEDPFDDPKTLVIPERSPEPTKEQLESGRIAADENVNEGVSKEELAKKIEDKELKVGTKILETVGDIPDADMKPPENVLFVCKLNPVTNAEDLKIIFSRFGKIDSCEIIKDFKTSESLCYGFVEFREVEACEKAYFKMDNVLIDDRRIHVDFCQSISKIRKWQKSAAFTMKTSEEIIGKDYGYELKRKSKDKYAMVFEQQLAAKKKERKKKKKYSGSESEEKEVKSLAKRDRSPEKTKALRRRHHSSSSASEESEDMKKYSSEKKRTAERKQWRKDDSSEDERGIKKQAKKKRKEVARRPSRNVSDDNEYETKLKKRSDSESDDVVEQRKRKETKVKKDLRKQEEHRGKLNSSRTERRKSERKHDKIRRKRESEDEDRRKRNSVEDSNSDSEENKSSSRRRLRKKEESSDDYTPKKRAHRRSYSSSEDDKGRRRRKQKKHRRNSESGDSSS